VKERFSLWQKESTPKAELAKKKRMEALGYFVPLWDGERCRGEGQKGGKKTI